LVIHDSYRFASLFQPNHGVHKIGCLPPTTGFPEKPASPDKVVFREGIPDKIFSRKLRYSIEIQRIRTIVFDIRSSFLAIKDIIRAEMD
jgi:hypothetical protein